MTLSSMLSTDAHTSGRIRFRLSWKTATLLAIPVGIGIAGLAYYAYNKKTAQVVDPDAEPNTPLEKARALKNKGNKFFKAGQYSKALQFYDDGLVLCPEDATAERAALYQNRAAAKENLRQYEAAIDDCSAALEQSPRYLKALNRRAHLYEKLENWEACLIDRVACCILEEFKNMDNIISMDQVLKKVGQKKAQVEWETLSHSLPSTAFIRNYLSAFAWNPFELVSPPSTVNGTAESESEESPSKGNQQSRTSDQFSEAYETLNKSLSLLASEEYEDSMKLALEAVTLFEDLLSKPTPKPNQHKADGDEPSLNNSDSKFESICSEDEAEPSADALEAARAASQKASLLYATYLALTGRAAEAKSRFQSVAAEGSGADSVVRVNALIKSACLAMSVDQDFAACLYDFQSAQSVCPDCPDVYLHRGQINLLADQLDEALHDLNTAVKLKPEFSIAQAQRLYTLYRKAVKESNSDRAAARVEDFRRLAQKYPNCIETRSLFAQVLSERGEFTESDAEFGKVIELAPSSGLAYAHRGLLQLRWKQDREEAFKWFSQGAKVDPKCELIHELLGQMAVERGDFKSALDHFECAIKESKTQNDLVHLISLREGVCAQRDVCQKYGLSVAEVLNSLKREQQQMMMGFA